MLEKLHRTGIVIILAMSATVLTSSYTAADGIWYRAGDCSSSNCYEYFAAGRDLNEARRVMRNHDECVAVGCSVLLECPGKGWFTQVQDRADAYYIPSYPAAYGLTCGYSSRSAAKSAAKKRCQSQGGRNCTYVRRIGYDDGSRGIKGTPE